MRTRQVGIVLTLALLAWQAAASMPRQAAPVNAGESQATNQDEILHWRSIGEASVIPIWPAEPWTMPIMIALATPSRGPERA
jgi:hypothetical protein